MNLSMWESILRAENISPGLPVRLDRQSLQRTGLDSGQMEDILFRHPQSLQDLE